MARKLEKQIALVTGGGTGIGRGIARELAQHGASVMITGNVAEDLVETAKLLTSMGGEVRHLVLDHAIEADGVRAVAETVGWKGRLDILVNNAAIVGQVGPVGTLDVEQWEACFRVNLTGVMVMCREAANVMIPEKRGVIVNVSSNVARRGMANRAPYVCSKWALNGLGQTLALELAPHGIRVNSICPGPVLTSRLEGSIRRMAEASGRTPAEIIAEWESESPMGRFVTVEECAKVVVFLATEEASAITGQALNVTAGALMT